jgi:phosphohistidine phosphatase SixA
VKPAFLILSLLAFFFLVGCDSCEVVRVSEGKLYFSDDKATLIPHWNEAGWTHFFFVRHAEKVDNSDDPDLSPNGYSRAERLGRIMVNSGLDLVFATDKLRTQKTAEKVQAMAHTPAIMIYPREDAAETDWLVQQLTIHRGKRIFVVGHSNTVPRMVGKLVGPSFTVTELDDQDFGAFIVVASRDLGDAEYLWKSY